MDIRAELLLEYNTEAQSSLLYNMHAKFTKVCLKWRSQCFRPLSECDTYRWKQKSQLVSLLTVGMRMGLARIVFLPRITREVSFERKRLEVCSVFPLLDAISIKMKLPKYITHPKSTNRLYTHTHVWRPWKAEIKDICQIKSLN